MHVVTGWLGNTPAVANKRYLTTTDDHFRQAVVETPEASKTGGATVGAVDVKQVVQSPVLSASDTDCQLHHHPTKKAENVVFPSVSGLYSVPPRGVEPLLPD